MEGNKDRVFSKRETMRPYNYFLDKISDLGLKEKLRARDRLSKVRFQLDRMNRVRKWCEGLVPLSANMVDIILAGKGKTPEEIVNEILEAGEMAKFSKPIKIDSVKMARDWEGATSDKGRPPIGGAQDD